MMCVAITHARPSLMTTFRVNCGILLPILCLTCDPGIFRRGGFGIPMFEEYRLAAWFIIAVEMPAFIVALWNGVEGARARSFLAGVLFAGAAFSAVIGVLLFPLALMGALMVIGMLGFSPILSAIAYLKTGLQMLREVPARRSWVVAGFLVLMVCAGSIQYGVVTATGRVIENLRSHDAAVVERAIDTADRWGFFLAGSIVADAARQETDDAARDNLERAAMALGLPIGSD